jgi:hypothetical protein
MNLLDMARAALSVNSAQAAELEQLVHMVADAHAFTDAERAEAKQNALRDPATALESFREIAKRLPR